MVRRFALLLLICVPLAARADFMSPEAAATFALTNAQFASGLNDLSDFRFLPDGRVVIVERAGTVRLRRTNGSLVTVGTFAVDPSDPELGLLGVEVHPSFATNGTLFFFLSAEAQPAATRNRVVSAVLTGETLNTAGAKTIVADIPTADGHNGGGLAVSGNELFISVGDSGCACGCSPGGSPTAGAGFNYNATCLTAPNGKILRVGLSGAIPSDNPLAAATSVTRCEASCRTAVNASVTGAPRKDIWAWGFRDPRRLWADPKTGRVWLADRGELTLEEIDVVSGGKHFGFPFREGNRGLDAGICEQTTPGSGNCVEPAYACLHGAASDGVDGECEALVGGPISDVCSWPEPFNGRYFFADAVNGNVYAVQPNAARTGVTAAARLKLATLTPGAPVSLQIAPDGALYVGVKDTGSGSRIAQISPLTAVACSADGGVDGGQADAGGKGGGGSVGGGGPVCCSSGVPSDGGRYTACGCIAEPGSSGVSGWWFFATAAGLWGLTRFARKARSKA